MRYIVTFATLAACIVPALSLAWAFAAPVVGVLVVGR